MGDIQVSQQSQLVFCDISVTADNKTILRDVSGLADAGRLLAIMGPSGKCMYYVPVPGGVL